LRLETVQHRVSAKDVANLAGVSRSAVSRTFGGGQVSQTIRTRVIAAADELGYRPNAIARSLIGGKTDLIAVIIAENDSIHNRLLIEKLIAAISHLGKRALVVPATADSDIDESALYAFDYQVDAMVVVGGTVSPRIIDQIRRVGVPLFLYERTVADTECITCDNVHGGRLAARFFLRCGRRRIAYLTKPRKTFSNMQRREGLLAELGEAGLALHAEGRGAQSFAGGYQAAIELMSAAPPPDAIFCFNDEMALGALQAAAEMKLSVPGDVALIGFDDIPMASWAAFELTTITNPIEPAVDILIERIAARLADPAVGVEAHLIKPSLVVRRTTP
jgi:DNA-binding LacI/PurR family transcriptional regulator